MSVTVEITDGQCVRTGFAFIDGGFLPPGWYDLNFEAPPFTPTHWRPAIVDWSGVRGGAAIRGREEAALRAMGVEPAPRPDGGGRHD
ncbi:hypothetical protein [Methylobacterium sp. WSM2598]|uniref:hypothetical protein n=1 Tax=Methylobacterium sp. WSM2598 TaxID=398261 RepID=UPI00037140DB|nr:hypothetical protein [Methylobacterium sp. WSM2598]